MVFIFTENNSSVETNFTFLWKKAMNMMNRNAVTMTMGT